MQLHKACISKAVVPVVYISCEKSISEKKKIFKYKST